MRTYHQLTPGERYELSALRKQGFSQAEIARSIGRHRSTISREVRRNSRDGTGRVYRPGIADEYACWRRARSRRNQRFTAQDWALVVERLQEQWSPEQIAGRFRRARLLRISHETIYKYVWADWARGSTLYLALRGARKKRWKRYRSYDSRGRLAGKRHISERPPGAQHRSRVGHLEGDTVVGSKDQHSILTLVDRKTGYVMIGKLTARNASRTGRRAIALINNTCRPVHSVTVDNGTEFHCYRHVEGATGVRFFFATPHHSWERGTSENTNGLIRQYLPKRQSMAHLTQRDCSRLAAHLNNRPRKRLDYLTPAECYEPSET
jgi:IS30 family transposase